MKVIFKIWLRFRENLGFSTSRENRRNRDKIGSKYEKSKVQIIDFGVGPGPTCDLELKDPLCLCVFWSFLKNSTFGFKISRGKIGSKYEQVKVKNRDFGVGPEPTFDLELKDHLCPGVFWLFLKNAGSGFKIGRATMMINAEEKIARKQFLDT